MGVTTPFIAPSTINSIYLITGTWVNRPEWAAPFYNSKKEIAHVPSVHTRNAPVPCQILLFPENRT